MSVHYNLLPLNIMNTHPPSSRPFIIDDLTPRLQRHLQEYAARSPARRCTCGRLMNPIGACGSFLWGFIPTSHEVSYRCPECHFTTVIPSDGEICSSVLGVGTGGLILFALVAPLTWTPSPEFSTGWVMGVLFSLFMLIGGTISLIRGLRSRRNFPVMPVPPVIRPGLQSPSLPRPSWL
jgi:hypothetical protein